MTITRRLDQLEAALSPTERVNRWLSTAHVDGSFEAWFRTVQEAGVDAMPLDRLARETKEAAQAQTRGLPRDERAEAVRSAIFATIFRFQLVLRIIDVTDRVQDRAELVLLALTTAANLSIETHGKAGGGCPPLEVLRDTLFARVADLHAFGEARTQAESKYLAGQPALFPAERTAWDELVHRFRSMAMIAWGLSERYGGAALDEERYGPTDPERVADYVRDLVEMARAKAYDEMGDGRRAVAVAMRWLRPTVGAQALSPCQVGETAARSGPTCRHDGPRDTAPRRSPMASGGWTAPRSMGV